MSEHLDSHRDERREADVQLQLQLRTDLPKPTKYFLMSLSQAWTAAGRPRSVADEVYWTRKILESIGTHDARVFPTTEEMIDHTASAEVDIGLASRDFLWLVARMLGNVHWFAISLDGHPEAVIYVPLLPRIEVVSSLKELCARVGGRELKRLVAQPTSNLLRLPIPTALLAKLWRSIADAKYAGVHEPSNILEATKGVTHWCLMQQTDTEVASTVYAVPYPLDMTDRLPRLMHSALEETVARLDDSMLMFNEDSERLGVKSFLADRQHKTVPEILRPLCEIDENEEVPVAAEIDGWKNESEGFVWGRDWVDVFFGAVDLDAVPTPGFEGDLPVVEQSAGSDVCLPQVPEYSAETDESGWDQADWSAVHHIRALMLSALEEFPRSENLMWFRDY